MTPHEPIFPNPDTLNEVPYGKFVLANLAARRATQIKAGAPPLVRIDSNNPLSIALAEIAAGKIKPIMGGAAAAAAAMDEGEDLAVMDLATEGLLLPGFDDDSLSGLGLEDLDDLEFDADEMEEEVLAVDEEVASITDLLDDDVEEEVEAAADDDTEISLEDLAVQEEAEAEDEDQV
jgi:DNA-directed RNA polymerase subunit omega